LVALVQEDKKEEVLWKHKESHQKFGKGNFFRIPKSSDIGRSLENISEVSKIWPQRL